MVATAFAGNRISLATVIAIALCASQIHAQTGTWIHSSPGNLLDNVNWAGGVVPNAAGAAATIGSNLTTAGSFTLDAPMTLGSLTFGPLSDGSGHTYTVTNGGAGSLHLQANSGTATIDTSQAGSVLDFYASGGGAPIVLGSTVNLNTAEFGGYPNLVLGNVSGGGGIVVRGAGVILNGTSSYTGGTTVAADAHLQGTTASLQGNIDTNSGALVRFLQNSVGTYAGSLTGLGAVAFEGGGVVTLSGTSSYSGGTTASATTLVVGSDSALGNPNSALALLGQSTLQTSASVISSRPITLSNGETFDTHGFSSVFTGNFTEPDYSTGGLLVTGGGSLTLTGNNTYSRGTDVTGATLYANSTVGSATGSGGIMLYSGGTLAGSGNVAGYVYFGPTAVLAPGNGPGKPGTLTLGTAYFTNDNSTILKYQLGAPGAIGGGVSSLTNIVEGDLTLGGGLLNVTGLPGFNVGSYRLINYSHNLIVNHGLTLGAMPAGFAGSVLDMSHAGQINLHVITIPGDVNGDHIVNAQDLAVVSGDWLNTGFSVAGDGNFDGIVNAQDLALISSQWLRSGGYGSSAAVPEPATLVLVLAGFVGVGCINLRKKRCRA